MTAYAWMDSALCAQSDPEAWFPPAGQPGDRAKGICSTCPVRAECQDYGVGEDTGVWGALGVNDRRRLRKR